MNLFKEYHQIMWWLECKTIIEQFKMSAILGAILVGTGGVVKWLVIKIKKIWKIVINDRKLL